MMIYLKLRPNSYGSAVIQIKWFYVKYLTI